MVIKQSIYMRLNCILIFIALFKFSNGDTLVQDKNPVNICPDVRVSLTCPSDTDISYTVFVDEALYGVRKTPGECKYTPGDCYNDISTSINVNCDVDKIFCNAYSSSTYKVSNCQNKRADYLHILYKCIPTKGNALKTFNICDNSVYNVTASNGFIVSPGYPNFQFANNECVKRIVAPPDQVIRLWVIDINIRSDSAKLCPNDYVKITDIDDSKVCGRQKTAFDNLCSSQIYVSYKATSRAIAGLKGFKLYYEFVDRSTQPDCPTGTPSAPQSATTPISGATTVSTTEQPLTAEKASEIFEISACKGTSTAIQTPVGYSFYRIRAFYGVTPNGDCIIRKENCKGPASILYCPFQGKCVINFFATVKVEDCNKQPANYLALVYRFIPIRSSINYTICQNSEIDASANPYGIITSTGYPKIVPNQNCKLRVSAPKGKIILAYITDLSLDFAEMQLCKKGYLAFNEADNGMKVCGSRTMTRDLSYVSCSNVLDITYVSSNSTSFYRGFNMYYEAIDANSEYCPDLSTTISSTKRTSPSTTRQGTTARPRMTSLVKTTGGNALGAPCSFPFTYNGTSYDTCINRDQSEYWCSTTPDYDKDKFKGNCVLGLTTTVGFNVCAGKIQQIFCPKGFNILIQSAEYATTSDGSCDFTKADCTSSAMSVASICTDKGSCFLSHSSRKLASCQNKFSNLMHIEYACIPNQVEGVPVLDFCLSQKTKESRGLIQTTNYPASTKELNCSLQLNVPLKGKQVNVYSIQVSITSGIIFDSNECVADSLVITDGIDKRSICASLKSELLFRSCENQLNFSLNIDEKSGRVKLFYEVVDQSSEFVCLSTDFSRPPITSTANPLKPIWENERRSSPTLTKGFCRNNVFDVAFGSNIQCPKDYVIVVRRSFYGISRINKCLYEEGDCISYMDNPSTNCLGRQNCLVIHSGKKLPECDNKNSGYLQVEYDCVPVSTRPRDIMCDKTFTEPLGIIGSSNYPIYENYKSCKVQINTNLTNIIKAYILDMAVADDCTNDYITFADTVAQSSVSLNNQTYCAQQPAILAIETCASSLSIELVTKSKVDQDNNLKGVLIYYEAIPRPSDFVCAAMTTTKLTSMVSTTTTSGSTATTLEGPSGLALPSKTVTVCASSSVALQCPANYVIVLLTTDYASANVPTSKCVYSPFDCFERTNLYDSQCSGKSRCSIVLFGSRNLASCGKRPVSYVYVNYRCVPSTNAGNPVNEVVEACRDNTPTKVETGLIIQSANYPKYPSKNVTCVQEVVTNDCNVIDVYLLDASLRPFSTNCNGSTDFLKVYDNLQEKVFCGVSNHGRYLFQTVSNSFSYIFNAINGPTGFQQRGFKLYLEAVKSECTTPKSTTPTIATTTTTPSSDYIGFISPVYHVEICQSTEKTLKCPDNYYVMVNEEHYIVTENGCSHSSTECKQPTDVAYETCSSQNECKIFATKSQLGGCGNKYLDLLDIEYQCLPASISNLKFYSCGDSVETTAINGYITSPEYPNYESDITNCKIQVKPKENFGYNIYIVDFGMNDPLENGTCTKDFIQFNDEEKLCSNDQPRLLYTTNDDTKVLTISHTSYTEKDNNDALKGFKLYFERFNLKELSTSTNSPSSKLTSKRTVTTSKIVIYQKDNHNVKVIGWSFGIGIPIFLAFCLSAVCLASKHRRDNTSNARINYSNMTNSDINDVKSFENPNFLVENVNLNFQ